MPSVSALVLLYDIRGFTAATKRMDAARIGAFATAAHGAILDQRDEALREVSKGYTFMAAETLYGLGHVPAP